MKSIDKSDDDDDDWTAPDHDGDDHEVAQESPDHAEDVDAEVESELRYRGPGVCHALRSVIPN